jgi:hypothetical protein
LVTSLSPGSKTVSNDMNDSTNALNPLMHLDTKVRTESPSGGLHIEASEVSLALLAPCAARTIIAGESGAEFDALAKIVAEFWQPQDVIEQLLMTDYINAQWELQRLRRLIPAAFNAGRPFAVSELEGYAEDRFCDSPFPSGAI